MSSITKKLCATFNPVHLQPSPSSSPSSSSSCSSLKMPTSRSMQTLRTSDLIPATIQSSPQSSVSLARYLMVDKEEIKKECDFDQTIELNRISIESPNSSELVSQRWPAISFSFRKRIVITFFVSLALAGCAVFRLQRRSLSRNWFEEIDLENAKSEGLRMNLLSEFEQALAVRTDCEWIVGSVDDGAFAFKGIEYAIAQRWQPPQPVWNHSDTCQPNRVRRASHFGEICAQIHPLNGKFHGSERCLYLNVWTPRLDLTAHLPVLVWLHSGFVQFGSGHDFIQQPSGSLARKLNAVIVSLNYRLDALAFATHENLALQDQLVALNWIQRNIQRFGGSVQRVTLAGADGGAACALALFTSGHLNSLVSRLWLTGPAVFHEHNVAAGRSLVDRFDLPEIHFTGQQLTAAQVLRTFLGTSGEPSFRVNDQNDLPIQGIFTQQWIEMDGQLVKQAYPFNRTSNLLNMKSIPILLGTATHAIEYWPGPRDLRNWTWAEYVKYVVTSLDSFSTHTSVTALHLYPPADERHGKEQIATNLSEMLSTKNLQQISNATQNQSKYKLRELSQHSGLHGVKDKPTLHRRRYTTMDKPSGSSFGPDQLYATMVSDIRQTCPVDVLASNLALHHRSLVYRYVITAKPSKPIQLFDYQSRHAFHLFEVIAFFDQLPALMNEPSEFDLQFARRIQQLVSDFLHAPLTNDVKQVDLQPQNSFSTSIPQPHAHPFLGEDGFWPRHPNSVALLDTNLTLVTSYAAGRCAFWTQQSLDRYAWIC